MGKFCKKCGYQFKSPGKFCPGCGAVREGEDATANVSAVNGATQGPQPSQPSQQAPEQPRPVNYQQVPPQVPPQMNYQQVPPQQMSYQQMPASNSNNAWKIAVIVVVLGVLAGIGYTFLNKSKDTQEAPPVVTQTEEQTQAPAAAPAPKEETHEEKMVKTQQFLKNKGLERPVVATSMGHNPNGYLAMVLRNNHYEFAICDTKNDRVATVEYASNLSGIAKSHSQQDKSVKFTMLVYNDTHDKDVKAGEWNAQTHIIPIKAVYAYDANGNIIDHGIYTQNNTLAAPDYSEYLYETKNVETVNILLTEMQALYDTAAKNNVRLP